MKVITFSRFFPVKHPRAGEPTYFVEKVLLGLLEARQFSIGKCCELAREAGFPESHPMYYIDGIRGCEFGSKYHTIRAGNRWKVGEQFSPRVWSGRPYASKQVQFAPPITIEKIWEVRIGDDSYGEGLDVWINDELLVNPIEINTLAINDGLSMSDFFDWFNIHPKMKSEGFTGQILCWNSNINY